MKKLIELTERDQIKAYMDPYRLDILQTFYKQNKPLTVKLVADALGETPAKVHYHVKKLEKNGILVLVFTKEINGILAKYYEPTAENFVMRNRDKKLGSQMNMYLRNNIEVVLDKEFNETKNLFIKSLRECPEGERFEGHFASERVYLTQEEVKEINEFLHRFSRVDETLKEDKNRKEYQFLYTILEILDGIDDQEDE